MKGVCRERPESRTSQGGSCASYRWVGRSLREGPPFRRGRDVLGTTGALNSYTQSFKVFVSTTVEVGPVRCLTESRRVGPIVLDVGCPPALLLGPLAVRSRWYGVLTVCYASSRRGRWGLSWKRRSGSSQGGWWGYFLPKLRRRTIKTPVKLKYRTMLEYEEIFCTFI